MRAVKALSPGMALAVLAFLAAAPGIAGKVDRRTRGHRRGHRPAAHLGCAGPARVVHGRYVNFGAAVVSYVEKPAFAPDWELRFAATYVVR